MVSCCTINLRTSQRLTVHKWLHLGDGHGRAGCSRRSGLFRFDRFFLRLGKATQGADVQCVGGLNSGEVFLRHWNHLYPGGVRLFRCLKFLSGGNREENDPYDSDFINKRHTEQFVKSSIWRFYPPFVFMYLGSNFLPKDVWVWWKVDAEGRQKAR